MFALDWNEYSSSERLQQDWLKMLVKGREVFVVLFVLVARGVKEKRHVQALSGNGTRTVQPVATAALKRASTI
eukprot:2145566-Amphidinium_carterae.2